MFCIEEQLSRSLATFYGLHQAGIVGFEESLVDDTEVGVLVHLALVVAVGGQLFFEELLGGAALLRSHGEDFANIDLLKVFAPDRVRFRLVDYVLAKGIASLYTTTDQQRA